MIHPDNEFCPSQLAGPKEPIRLGSSIGETKLGHGLARCGSGETETGHALIIFWQAILWFGGGEHYRVLLSTQRDISARVLKPQVS